MKSISIMNSDAIRKHPSNNSSSKNAYRFSQSKRFPDPNPQCKIAFYANDSQLSHRKASFGYGTKLDFTKDRSCSPPATKYNQKTFLDQSKKTGKSFGLNREQVIDKSYYLPHMYALPGPGKYNHNKEPQNNLSYTMRSRTIDINTKKLSFKANPGPGTYEDFNLDPKTGRFMVSKFSDAKYCKINPNTPRFENTKQSPGPSHYHQKDNLSSQGKYILSNHKGAGTRGFQKTARSNFTDQFRKTGMKFPGPGDYQPPSEFGIYGDAEYYRTMKDFKTVQ